MSAETVGGRPRVVIVGGGFGGLYAAKALASVSPSSASICRRRRLLSSPTSLNTKPVSVSGIGGRGASESAIDRFLGQQALDVIKYGAVAAEAPQLLRAKLRELPVRHGQHDCIVNPGIRHIDKACQPVLFPRILATYPGIMHIDLDPI